MLQLPVSLFFLRHLPSLYSGPSHPPERVGESEMNSNSENLSLNYVTLGKPLLPFWTPHVLLQPWERHPDLQCTHSSEHTFSTRGKTYWIQSLPCHNSQLPRYFHLRERLAMYKSHPQFLSSLILPLFCSPFWTYEPQDCAAARRPKLNTGQYAWLIIHPLLRAIQGQVHHVSHLSSQVPLEVPATHSTFHTTCTPSNQNKLPARNSSWRLPTEPSGTETSTSKLPFILHLFSEYSSYLLLLTKI